MFNPPHFATVTPYLIADRADELLRFLVVGLGGEVTLTARRPDGAIAMAHVRFGDSSVMLSEAAACWPARPCSLYLYVVDADASMARALAAGSKGALAVQDMPYGDRQGGVRDCAGNLWWLSQRLEEGPYSV